MKAGLFYPPGTNASGAGIVDYESFLKRGLGAIIRETEEGLRSFQVNVENSPRIDYYRAAIISMQAVIHLAHRYADLAQELSERTGDSLRRAELRTIAEVCHHVPENPSRNFHEVVQAWWFLHLGVQIEQSGCGSSPGRIGQYLDPYYQEDKIQGLSANDATAWPQCLFVKILEYGYYQGIATSQRLSGHTGHTISVGGLTANGEDATTELDYLLLDTQIALRNIQPTITVLYHDGLREDFPLKAVELERTGLGQPQWLNNRVVVERILARHARNGITLEDARNCANISCVGKLLSLVKSYMDAGGSHIQFNVVGSETLRQAKEKPEEYKNLTVRVAGFSAYSTRLHQGVQDEIISVPNSVYR